MSIVEATAKVVLGACIVGIMGAECVAALEAQIGNVQRANSIYTQVIEPTLYTRCSPTKELSTVKEDGVTAVLATKLLLRHPEKIKEICAIVNAQHTRSRWANKQAMENLALSLGVDISNFETRRHDHPILVIQEIGPEMRK